MSYPYPDKIEVHNFPDMASAPNAADWFAEHGSAPFWVGGAQYVSNGTSISAIGGGSGVSKTTVRPKIYLIGDSFVDRDEITVVANPPTIGTKMTGIFRAAITELKQGLEIIGANGVTGTLVIDGDMGAGQGFISRLPEALASDADYIYVPFSVNSFKNSTVSMSYGALVSAYSDVFQQIRAAGKIPVTTTYFPSFFTDTATEQLTSVRFSDWLLDQQTSSDLIVCDVRYACADNNSLILGANQNAVEKVGGVIGNTNVHRNPAGVILDAKAIALSMRPYLKELDIPWIHSYNAGATNSRISAIQNPIMIGTAGNKDNGTTGDVASSWGVSPANGDTCVASKVARNDSPGQWQQIVWTPSSGARKLELYSSPRFSMGDKIAGDDIEYFLEFEIDDVNVNILKSIFCSVTFYNTAVVNVGSAMYNTDFSNSNTDIDFPMIKPPSGIIATPKISIPPGTVTALFKFGLYSFAGGSPITLRVGRVTYI